MSDTEYDLTDFDLTGVDFEENDEAEVKENLIKASDIANSLAKSVDVVRQYFDDLEELTSILSGLPEGITFEGEEVMIEDDYYSAGTVAYMFDLWVPSSYSC